MKGRGEFKWATDTFEQAEQIVKGEKFNRDRKQNNKVRMVYVPVHKISVVEDHHEDEVENVKEVSVISKEETKVQSTNLRFVKNCINEALIPRTPNSNRNDKEETLSCKHQLESEKTQHKTPVTFFPSIFHIIHFKLNIPDSDVPNVISDNLPLLTSTLRKIDSLNYLIICDSQITAEKALNILRQKTSYSSCYLKDSSSDFKENTLFMTPQHNYSNIRSCANIPVAKRLISNHLGSRVRKDI